MDFETFYKLLCGPEYGRQIQFDSSPLRRTLSHVNEWLPSSIILYPSKHSMLKQTNTGHLEGSVS